MTKTIKHPGNLVIGIDVGTGSTRAGLFDLNGNLLASAVNPIQIFRPQADYVEQSSRDIWQSVCQSVKDCLEKSGVEKENIIGISFDATCSLVALDENDAPVSVDFDGDDEKNIIVWMDHRATKQADEINQTKHRVLDYVGGQISPEQEPPKLKWIKENLPETWRRTRRFFDLADYLVYEATKKDVRSLCTVVCKWTYLGHENCWDKSFFEQINLADLFEPNRVGERIAPMGTRAGNLTAQAAQDLGLSEKTVVGVGIIDAHSGGLGSLGMTKTGEKFDRKQIENTLALIGGTSSCHLATAPEARFVPGVWGPYFGAMLPEMWLAEGGQSATGALVDFVIENHAFAPKLHRKALESGLTIYELLNDQVAELRKEGGELTKDLHILPDFNGNRSPCADPYSRGMWSGLTLDASFESLAKTYLATIQAIAYGTRHIIESLNAQGYDIRRIHASGGGTKNPLWMQEHADICGMEILIAEDSESVMLGAAMLAAVAAGKFDSIFEAMRAMSPAAETVEPNFSNRDFHERKYRVFKLMYEHQREYREIMDEKRSELSTDAHG